ncbi:type I restriction-modification enzyme R subunit C-terminal domain-containing protein [Novipirellula galeiformis]|uniref:type I restriction-modification enzyme R subunit C-terminal domain-containing protein n=1 Tax=Novipirellula galeiformis TaxID=2528004 RepID=UPI0011B611B2|nr:type I restriction-modification enzyme R subunit C-terminal domain-containing protein [Novipirellula galeiformis]
MSKIEPLLGELGARAERYSLDNPNTAMMKIRQLGELQLPYEQRVKQAISKIVASRTWTDPQRKWLKRIGKQLEREVVVDHQTVDSGQFGAQGGYQRLNSIFNGELDELLHQIAEEIWDVVA